MRKRILAACSAVLLLAAGCGGNAPATTVGGSHAPAPTGETIVIGMTNQEGSPAGSWPELRVAAQAAVSYINTELGGLYGRPLKLDTCVTDGSPEGSTKCANQILADKPLVVVGGADTGSDASMPIYTSGWDAIPGGCTDHAVVPVRVQLGAVQRLRRGRTSGHGAVRRADPAREEGHHRAPGPARQRGVRRSDDEPGAGPQWSRSGPTC